MSEATALQSASECFQLAFLLTRDQQMSEEATFDYLDYNCKAVLSGRTRSETREFLIRRALDLNAPELEHSMQKSRLQTVVSQSQMCLLPPPAWAQDHAVKPEDLQAAILAIDTFPRCALLLTVFEGLTCQIAAALLQADVKLTEASRSHALLQLTHNLALQQGWSGSTARTGFIPLAVQCTGA